MNDSCLDKDGQKALALGEAFIKSIMENEEEEIPKSDGMSVLRNVIDLETGKTRDVVLRSITIPFWKKCLEVVRMPESATALLPLERLVSARLQLYQSSFACLWESNEASEKRKLD